MVHILCVFLVWRSLDLSQFVNHRHNPSQVLVKERSSSDEGDVEDSDSEDVDEEEEQRQARRLREASKTRKRVQREQERKRYQERIKRETLDPEDCTYDLCGLIRHMGVASGGHYVAYALNHISNKWLLFHNSPFCFLFHSFVALKIIFFVFFLLIFQVLLR